MIDKICNYLTNKIRKQIPYVDEQRAEVIDFGLHILIGEMPKTFIFIFISLLLGMFKEFVITFLVIFPYRAVSGGFHLKTHIGCIVATSLVYCGVPYISEKIIIAQEFKYILITLIWIFGMLMCKLYAPADTENIPILRKKERKTKRILSYIVLTITLIIGVVIKNNTISNIIILGMLVQSIMISKLAYRITNNKYGYEVYN